MRDEDTTDVAIPDDLDLFESGSSIEGDFGAPKQPPDLSTC